jgi:transcription antitermination factor NusG
MPARWHVLRTKASIELSTTARLALAGFRALAPVAQQWRRPRNYMRKALEDVPILVRYIFAAAPIADWPAILAVPGVTGVLMSAGAIATVEQGEIERMMRVASSRRPIEVGDRVAVAAGPFLGLDVEVAGVDEVRRLIQTNVTLLGAARPVQISVDVLAA